MGTIPNTTAKEILHNISKRCNQALRNEIAINMMQISFYVLKNTGLKIIDATTINTQSDVTI